MDILVNNAGIQHVAPVEQFPPERWDAVIAINLSAAFYAVRAALPRMKRPIPHETVTDTLRQGFQARLH